MLDIILCVKQVPTQMVFKNEKREEKYILNPYDLHALNELVSLKKRIDCKITCLCMGKLDMQEQLTRCKAMGADNAILLSDIKFAGADTFATTYTLEKGINKIHYDLIVCGAQAIDGETGQVPYGLATRLGISCISNVISINNVTDNIIEFVCQDDKYLNTYTSKLPIMLVFKDFTTKVGKISLRALKKAKLEKIKVLTSYDIDVDETCIGEVGSKTIVLGSKGKVYDKKETEFIEGNCEEKVDWLENILNKYVI